MLSARRDIRLNVTETDNATLAELASVKACKYDYYSDRWRPDDKELSSAMDKSFNWGYGIWKLPVDL